MHAEYNLHDQAHRLGGGGGACRGCMSSIGDHDIKVVFSTQSYTQNYLLYIYPISIQFKKCYGSVIKLYMCMKFLCIV